MHDTTPYEPAMPNAGAQPRAGWGSLGVVFALAMVVRVAHLLATWSIVFVDEPVGDARSYLAWAVDIAQGDWIGSAGFYQAPAYPYTLGMLFAVVGPSVVAVRIAQAVGGSLACVALAAATRHWYGPRAGILAGVLLALYAPAIFYDGIVQKASLAALLLTLLLSGLACYGARPRAAWAAGLGVLLAALALTRENALIWLPILAGWITWRGWRSSRSCRAVVCHVLTLGAGLALPLGLVVVRNVHVTGEWAISTFQLGPNLYIGNGADATGRYRPLVPGHETPEFERADATRLAEQATGRELSPREVSRYWTQRSLHEITANPPRWLRLMGRKLLMAVNAYEVPDVESLTVYRARSPALAGLAWLANFGVLLPLAVAGLVWRPVRRACPGVLLWMLGSMLLAVVAFYIMGRYRYPLAILLMPLAAGALNHAWSVVRAGRWRALALPVLVGGLAAVVAQVPVHDTRRLDALAWMNYGATLGSAGRLDEAIASLEQAVRLQPGSAEAHFNLAQAYALQGDDPRAIPHYRAAAQLQPASSEAQLFLAEALERSGATDEALVHYQRALELDPTSERAAAGIHRLTGERVQRSCQLLAISYQPEGVRRHVPPSEAKAVASHRTP